MDSVEIVLLFIEIIVSMIMFIVCRNNDKLDKIESVLEDINAKLGEKEED